MNASVGRRIILALVLVASTASSASAQTPRTGAFKTPSGNIVCDWSSGRTASAECGIKSGIRPTPPRKRCEGGDPVDSYISLARSGRASFVPCLGDPGPLLPGLAAEVLAYGRTFTWAGNAMQCTSRRSGLTCTNRAGHGFTVSRARTRRF